MKIEGFVGICGACFEPIREHEEIQFRKNGSYFHKLCFEKEPDSYYLALERIRGDLEKGVDPVELMKELKRIFTIPKLNNVDFNEDNPLIIKLYREIGNSIPG